MAASTPSTFPFFSSLAPELRDQIWRCALPEEDVGPTLFLYKKGCWYPRGVPPDLVLEFRHDLLDPLGFDLPHVFVNHEARRIALAWIDKQRGRIVPQPKGDSQHPRFTRHFDPTQDILCITPSMWPDFLLEAVDRIALPDLAEHAVRFESSITRVALPKAVILDDFAALPEVWFSFSLVDELYLVLNEHFTHMPTAEGLPWTAAIRHQENAYVWEQETRRFTQAEAWRGRPSSNHQAMRTLFEDPGEANQVLLQELSRNHIPSFLVQPIFVAKR